ncbi:ATP-binding protein [Cellulomonas composti]|uniref:ATP-binding protein n=1 Tax=Cellulomonas composti TaxID=266130 RepID=A0A511JBC1_9CELL|nr:ATP-binding protein [Cellulomonas composti]
MRRRRPVVSDELVLPAEPTAPRVARRWVMRTAAHAGVGGTTNQLAELLTAELVANAVVHAPDCGDVSVRVVVDSAVLRVEVTDGGAGRPVLRHAAPSDPNGRGLALVEALSVSWGATGAGIGKTVWFELAADA